MKLKIFDYIDRAACMLEKNTPLYHKLATKIVDYLTKTLEGEDAVVGVTYRIKNPESLKEKIVRNSLYKQFDADKVLFAMHDVIGIRCECRFLADEINVFKRLANAFNKTDDGIYYYCEGKKSISLKLGSPQPEHQKNGLKIYRIDGMIIHSSVVYEFELQIKSLVNSFWSEIEHKLIYKNKRVMGIDALVSDLMHSINENLVSIDHQLNTLYEKCMDRSIVSQTMQVENMLSSIINDVTAALIREKLGLSVNFKEYSMSIVKYMLNYSTFAQTAGGAPLLASLTRLINENPDYNIDDALEILKTTIAVSPQDESEVYGSMLRDILRALRDIDFNEIPVGEDIDLKPLKLDSDLERTVCDKLLSSANDDFNINTFLHVFCMIETGTYEEDITRYIKYYAHRIGLGKTQEEIEKAKYLIRITKPEKLMLESEIERIAALKE